MASFTGNNKLHIISNNYASLFFFFFFSLVMLHIAQGVKHAPKLFIFGDSTFDVGTNNFLRSKAKANFPYNGIDFPRSIPTGRFSNGFNTADQIARELGYLESPAPFLGLERSRNNFMKSIIRHGLNFASAGSGILTETGSIQWGEVNSLGKQVEQFGWVRGNMSEIFGSSAKASRFISNNALFLISVGSNDLFDYARNHTRFHYFTNQQYLALLQRNYYSQIRKLHELGARKFGILGVAPIGCCPAVISGNGGNCVKPLNDLSMAFYSVTQILLQRLSYELKEFQYSLGNSFLMINELLENPSAGGLKETRSACCGSGNLNGQGPCIKAPNTNLCVDRNDHLFWDMFHPTQAASQFAANTLFLGGTKFVTPVNFRQLVS